MKSLKIIFFVGCLLMVWSRQSMAYDNTSIVSEDILKMSFEEMLNIKISTAGKKEDKIADIPASAVIITRNDIEKYGYSSLEEILENVPGMFVIDDYAGYRKTFGVRGFYAGFPRNIIFLINGVSQTESLFDYNEMSNFRIPVEAIDRIEVVRGPMSVLYGQGAFFGAINIITNDPDDRTSLVALSLGKGTEKAATKVTGSQGDFIYSLSGGFTDSDGPDHELAKMVTNMSTLDSWGIDETNNTTEDRLERNAKNFIFSGKYKKFYTDMSFNKSSDEVFIYKPSVTSGSPYDRNLAILSLGYEDQVADKVRLNGKISYHAFSFDLGWDISNSSFDGSEAGETSGESDTFKYELDAFVNVFNNLDLTTGLSLTQARGTSFDADIPIFNIFDTATTNGDMLLWAAFTQLSYTPWEKMKIIPGLRLERMQEYEIFYNSDSDEDDSTRTTGTYSDDEVAFIPSLAGIYSINDQNIVKLLYGKAIARPSFFQNKEQVKDDLTDLEAEEIHTIEANYIAILSPIITVNSSLFHNILDNLIARTVSTEAAVLTSNFTNGGKLVTDGMELTLQAKPVKKLLTEISLTYQNTEDQREGFEDIDVAYSPHFLGYGKMAYAVTGDITFALTGTYVDKMDTEWDVRLNNYTGGRVGKSVDGYFLLGANLRIDDILGTGCYLNIHGANLLDEEYRYPTYVNNTWADRGTLGDPLEILITVGKKF